MVTNLRTGHMASRAALREYQADKKKASAAAVSSSLSSSSSSSSSSSAFAGRQLAIDSYKCPACEYQDMSQFYQKEKGDWTQCEHCPHPNPIWFVPTTARNSVTTRPNAITILATNKVYYTFVILSCTIKYTGYGDDYSNSSRRIMEAQILEISSSLEKLERLEYLFPD